MRHFKLGITLVIMATGIGSAVHAQSASDRIVLRQLSGCYALTIGAWSSPREQGDIQAQTPPSQFRLDTGLVRQPGDAYFAVQPEVLVDSARMRAGWKPPLGDSLTVVWSTGFSGVTLRLAVRGNTLIGRATTFKDYHIRGEPPDPTASAVAVRVTCPPAGSRTSRGDSVDVLRTAWQAMMSVRSGRVVWLWVPTARDTSGGSVVLPLSTEIREALVQAGISASTRRPAGDDTVVFRLAEWKGELVQGRVEIEFRSSWSTVLGIGKQRCRTRSGNIQRYRVTLSGGRWTAADRVGPTVHGDDICFAIPPR